MSKSNKKGPIFLLYNYKGRARVVSQEDWERSWLEWWNRGYTDNRK